MEVLDSTMLECRSRNKVGLNSVLNWVVLNVHITCDMG